VVAKIQSRAGPGALAGINGRALFAREKRILFVEDDDMTAT
jgi:hypothetical protein